MSKLVTLDEIEAYEAEVKRAHAENRAPALRNPHEVFADNIGNADSHLEEKSSADQTKETNALHKARRDALNQDKKQLKVIRDNSNRLPDGVNDQVLPYQAPDPKRQNGPKNTDERDAIARKVDADYEHNRAFDDSFADSNIPNLTDDGQVMGDSVTPKLTRKMTTFSPEELVRENERNSVPVPERYKLDNPPLVIQQTGPAGEPPVPEESGYHEDYVAYPDSEDYKPKIVDAGDVPLTAISQPWPEHVIGDETGTTREPTRENETDVNEPASEPDVPLTVPLTEGQVLQGAVKRPDYFNPPGGPNSEFLSQQNQAGVQANLPADSTGLRGDNAAHKAVEKVAADDVNDPDYVSPQNREETE
jgi:hypothetical protein